jgi:predicted MFS family arabinose efflux permease
MSERSSDSAAPELTQDTRAFEPWYVAQAVTGLVWLAGGIFLLPAYLGSLAVSPADIGLIMSMIGVGALTSPVLGGFADRQLAHRGVQQVGLVAFILGAIGFGLAEQTLTFAVSAMLIGFGQGAVMTVNSALLQGAGLQPAVLSRKFANLQSMLVVGQAIGLLLISVGTSLELAYTSMFWALAALAVVGLVATVASNAAPVDRLHEAMRRRGATSGASASTDADSPTTGAVPGTEPSGLKALLASALGLFLLTVLITQSGQLALETQYPLYMDDVFGVGPSVTSAALSLMVVLSLLAFGPVGRLMGARGPLPVWLVVLVARIAGSAGLLILALVSDAPAAVFPLLMYLVLILSYPFLNTGGPDLAVRVSTVSPGTAAGAFFGTLAVCSIVGPSLGGWIASTYGFEYLPWAVLVGAALGLVIVLVGLVPRMARR